MERTFELHFFRTHTDGCYELMETIFSGSSPQRPYHRSIRGKLSGYLESAHRFRWSPGVKAVTALALRHRLSANTPGRVTGTIVGPSRSSSASGLQYALAHGSKWLEEMFGRNQSGDLVANTLFIATSPVSSGMATVRVNRFALSPSNVRVLVEGRLITDTPTLLSILEQVQCRVVNPHLADTARGLTQPSQFASSRP